MESFIEWIIESSLLVFMIIGIRKFFTGKIRYAVIYALWGFVLLRFLIPMNFVTTPVSAAKLISDAISVREASGGFVRGVENGAGTGWNVQQGGIREVVFTDKDVSDKRQGYSDRKVAADKGESVHMSYEDACIPQKANVIHAKAENGYFWTLFCRVWAVGAVVIFVWFLSSNVCLLRKIKRDRVLYGVRDNIKIYSVSAIKNPCLYGFLKPGIYLPAPLVLSDAGKRADSGELEQIITHEFVHYRHGDHIWAMLRMLVVSVYWFDPFVWVASACSKKDAELFCDETVLRILGEEKRFCYGEMLVRLAGDANWGDFRYSMLPMSRRGKEMEKRIRAISEKKRYSKWVLVPFAAVLSITLAITCSAGITPHAKENSQKEKSLGEVGGGSDKVSASSAKQAEQNSEAEAKYTVSEQLLAYSGLLRDNAEKSRFRYYSLAWLSDNHVVLLVSSHANDNTETKYASSSCRVYNVMDGKAVYCGDMACSSSGEYVHVADGKIMADTHHSVTSAKVEADSDKLVTETAEETKNSDGYSGDVEFLKEFAMAATSVFYTNPYTGRKITQYEPKAMSLADNMESYIVYDHGYDYLFEDTDTLSATVSEKGKEVHTVYADTPEAAFELYISSFTDAVNTGDTGKLHQVLYVNSDVYEQQCGMAKNYYKRGIRETVKSCSVVKMEKTDKVIVEIISKEKIKVSYADKTSKTVKQSYCYTCEFIDGTWVITKMEDANQ